MGKKSISPTNVTACMAQNTMLSTVQYSVLRKCKTCGGDYYWHHFRCKSEYCCECRAIHRREYLRNRENGSDSPPVNFEPVKAFVTMNEVNAYLENNKLQCLICGGRYKGLQQHIDKFHGMTADDYKFRFGIPYKRGLVGVDTSILHSKHGKMMMQDRKDAGKFQAFIDASSVTDKGHPRPIVEAVKQIRRKAVSTMLKSENHIKNLTKELVVCSCSKCGEKMFAKPLAIITRGCVILCKSCAYKNWHELRKKSIADFPEKYKSYQSKYYQKNKDVKNDQR